MCENFYGRFTSHMSLIHWMIPGLTRVYSVKAASKTHREVCDPVRAGPAVMIISAELDQDNKTICHWPNHTYLLCQLCRPPTSSHVFLSYGISNFPSIPCRQTWSPKSIYSSLGLFPGLTTTTAATLGQAGSLETRNIVLQFWHHHLWLHQAHRHTQFRQARCWATERW